MSVFRMQHLDLRHTLLCRASAPTRPQRSSLDHDCDLGILYPVHFRGRGTMEPEKKLPPARHADARRRIDPVWAHKGNDEERTG